jgi:diacylglycerol kinase (ATP)
MTIYVDVERSAEALQEDEELIEAVEALVETAAVSVQREIASDVRELFATLEAWMVYLFPVVLEYRENHDRMWEDLEKFALVAFLFLMCFLFLGPSRRNPNQQPLLLKLQQQKWRKDGTSWWNSLLLRSDSKSLGSFHSSPCGSSKDHNGSGSQSDGSERDHVKKNEEGFGFDGYEPETDEQRFQGLWPSIVATSRYSALVLPPACKLLEKPKRSAVRSKTSIAEHKQQHPSTENLVDGRSTTANKYSDDDGDDDDNPAERLQTYWRHLLHFLRSVFTYDYAGAGYSLIFWMQGIQKYRETNIHGGFAGESEQLEAVREADLASVDSCIVHMKDHPRTQRTAVPASIVTDPHVSNSSQGLKTGSLSGTPEERNVIVSTKLSPLPEETKDSLTASSSSEVSILPEKFHRAHIENRPSDLSSVNSDLDGSSSDFSVGGESYSSSRDHSSVPPQLPLSYSPLRQHSTSSGKRRDALEAYRLPMKARSASIGDEPEHEKGQPPSTPQRTRSDDIMLTPPMQSENHRESILRQKGSPSHSQKGGSERFFFETANSRDSLKRMSAEATLPDKNGYVLGDDLLPDFSKWTPLLVFVNSRAGPQQGHLLITQLRRLLNPIQIWDLANGGPDPVLDSFCAFTRLRILVCGGDGTVAWIISALEGLNLQRKWPPIAILPLGTGNDLARIHGWGGGYNNESLITILEQISESYVSLLDRWEVTIEDVSKKKKETKSFFNYLGVGADAQAALQVHYLRESRPEWFFSRLVNKAWYGVFGAEDILKATSVNVRKDITLIADGVEVLLPPDSQGIIVMNIDSYAGGVPLWSHGFKAESSGPTVPSLSFRRTQSMDEFRNRRTHVSSLFPAHQRQRENAVGMERVDSMDDLHQLSEEDRFAHVTACNMPSSCQDGILEIVSIRGAFHLGQIKVGLSNAQRLCQCREATIQIRQKMAVQGDGEPWRQSACTLRVKRKRDHASMLHRSADDGGVETEMSKLLDWAEERQLVDRQVHTILMKEFSRRIESHTRQRRSRSQDNLLFHNLKRAIGSTKHIPALSGNHWSSHGDGTGF